MFSALNCGVYFKTAPCSGVKLISPNVRVYGLKQAAKMNKAEVS